MKVNEIRYERVTLEETKEKIAAAVDAVRGAKSGKDLAEIREKMVKPAMVDFYTAASLCNARYTQDTRDAFYKAEMDYYDEVGPLMQDAYLQFTNALLDSPYRKEAEAFINPLFFANYELARKAHSPEIIADEQEESRLVTAYSALMSQMQFDWEGKKVPMPIIRGKMQADDRAVRRAAAEALGRGMAEHAAELDDLYDQLVRVRDRQAKKLGLRSYTALGYYRMGRIDYDREMVETFRDNVLADIVPAAKRIKEEVARALGWESVMLYDDAVYFGGGQPEPKLSAEGILEAGREMYRKMSPETGKFMDKMLAAGAFDVLSRDGKWGGGYCTEFTKYEQIFILANFNGSSGDVDVVTHEFGHGFAMDMQFQSGDWELQVGGMETAECHSMSMEFFCWKYMDLFFDDAEKYKLKHLLDSFTFIPYGCMVDEFQHIVYDNPSLTPAERKETWNRLEAKYRPYLTTKGIPYLEEGTRWQYQMHIYESPFYYIDYCLAQTVALGFLLASRKDYDGAFEKYCAFCRKGGTERFSELVREAGVPSPFEEGALKTVADGVTALYGALKAQ